MVGSLRIPTEFSVFYLFSVNLETTSEGHSSYFQFKEPEQICEDIRSTEC